jgi:hypothetical protein
VDALFTMMTSQLTSKSKSCWKEPQITEIRRG